MKRLSKLSVALSAAALLALASADLQIATADPGEADLPITHQTAGTCEAAPNTARDGAADGRLADIRAHLKAAEIDPDTIPLNGSGYNYRSDARVSNELLFMDAELQRR